MIIYNFNQEAGKKITTFDSNFVMTRILNTDSKVHIGCMRLEENGIIGYHQAAVPQLLLVMDGKGEVRGQDDINVNVESGDAVFWEEGEWHETKTVSGLMVIVIEGKDLNPSMYMSKAVRDDH